MNNIVFNCFPAPNVCRTLSYDVLYGTVLMYYMVLWKFMAERLPQAICLLKHHIPDSHNS